MINFLLDLKDKCKSHSVPIITDNSEIFIKNILDRYKPKKCLEIWTAVWYSTIFQANIIQNRNWYLYWFEISKNAYRQALDNINKSKLQNINIYNFDFSRFPLKKVLKEIDYVFIDALKVDYWKYLELIQHIKSNNCIVILDDIIKYDYKMTWLYEFIQKNQIKLTNSYEDQIKMRDNKNTYSINKIDNDDWIMVMFL